MDKRLLGLLIVSVSLVGCAATRISEKAAKIQVHDQMSSLLNNCKNLGPVSTQSGGFLMGWVEALAQAKTQAREVAFEKGGDTLVIINIDGNGSALTLQAAALRCY